MDNEGYSSSSSSSDTEFGSCSSVFCATKIDSSTQTEIRPVTIRSWLLETTLPSPNSTFSSLTSASASMFCNYIGCVKETHSVGFSVSTQTLDRELYSRSKSEMTSIVASWRTLTILIPSFLCLLLYFLDQLLDIIVCAQFHQEEETWMFGLSLAFLLGPSILISIFAYEQLTLPDVASIKPMRRKVGRILCLLQLTPYYLIGRKFWWSLKAWSWAEHRNVFLRNKSHEIWAKAELENDSTTVKLLQSLLESVPQLSLQSYVLLHKLSSKELFDEEGPSTALWTSVFVNLLSASSGISSSQSQTMFERVAGSVAVFVTLGSRAMVCGGVGILHPSFWIVPVIASFFIGFVTKVSESLENTFFGHLGRFKKYALEAFVMASVAPPFDATGFFCSATYVLAAFVFMMDNPKKVVHILAPILAICGQAMWILFGFLLMKKPVAENQQGIT